MSATLVWFRRDLRLQDNPALRAALQRGEPIVPVYVHETAAVAGMAGEWAEGAASRWWLHHSLAALETALRERGLQLQFARGPALAALRELRRASGADAVYWNRRYEPAAVAADAAVKTALREEGGEVKSFNAALLHEPMEVLNRQGGPFQVFTAYWRECGTRPVAAPLKLPAGPLPALRQPLPGLALEELNLLPRRIAAGFAATWQPGEAGARERLRRFIADGLGDYDGARDVPGREGTSRLSAHLHFGEVGPRQIWAAIQATSRASGVFPPSRGAGVYLRELGWREFAHQLLFHFPHTPLAPLRAEFARFPWADDPGGVNLRAWQEGRTGYPIVDAGMRQLAETGWMHNRVRMIAASFLVKHLRLPWLEGARWFWQTLVDADLANNTLGWQWTAGCGADAAPYFRIFAPVLQGRKFDGQGEYVRRWVPELARLPAEWVHAPWTAPAEVLRDSGIVLGETYPLPVVDHAAARAAALGALRAMRQPAAEPGTLTLSGPE
jgi:deoxyribodipyrimidine photo-lyase